MLTQDLCYELLPEWSGLEVEITPLSGGITNKLFRARSTKGDYTVRIYGDKTELFIDREAEAHAICAMADLGVTGRLVKYLPERGVTIVEYIADSTVLTNEQFRDPTLHAKIMEPIRRVHASGVTLRRVFDPLVQVREMAKVLEGLGVAYPEFDIAGTLDRLSQLAEIIAMPRSELTPCHNDLLADNFILIRPEAAARFEAPMYLIDWEYAGMAPPSYDIADMFQEILAPRETEEQLVAEYCQGHEEERTLYLIDLFKPYPDIYWFLWSLVQLSISSLDFDYYDYGKPKYEHAVENLERIRETYGLRV